MKRRQAIRSLLSLPAVTAIPALAQQAPTDKTNPADREKAPPEIKPATLEETPKLAMTQADAVVEGLPGFFMQKQLATLKRLADLLVPANGGKPGAVEAEVPEFLDFLIRESPAARQELYRLGLDALETSAKQSYGKAFAELDASQADALLAPLRAPWTFRGPGEPAARFLLAAKEDVLRAAMNSREWAAASKGRRATGVGAYWFPIE